MKAILFFLLFAFYINYDATAQCTTPLTISTTVAPASCPFCCDGNLSYVISGGCNPILVSVTPDYTLTMGFCAGITYTIQAQDAGCCPVVTQAVLMTDSTTISLNNVHPKASTKVYLINNDLIIENNNAAISIELFDLNMKKVFNQKISEIKEVINIPSLSEQVYVVLLKNKDNTIVYKQKIITAY